MDEVLNQLESTAISADDENKTRFDELYKNWGRIGNQNERRKEILENQKKDRNTKLDKFRGIFELVQAVERNGIFKTHNRAYYRPTIYVAGFNKAPSYSQVLMMSEWMVEKPIDFEENWMVVPAPKGTRTLIVANNGITKFYTKQGHFMFECRTGLPGGNPCDPKWKVNRCVLDGFYLKKENILYVLDCLAWNIQPMTDGELAFRDHWLKSQFFELDALTTFNKKNEVVIHLLPKKLCTPEIFESFMMQVHFKIDSNNDCNALDGLLFYHKSAQYFAGETPLVGWLYPYMVPEILGEHIQVNNAYLLQKPENYKNQADYIIEFNRKQDAKKSRSRGGRKNSARSNEMDTADAQTENTPKESKPTQKCGKHTTESMEAEGQSNAKPKEKAQTNTESMDSEALNDVKAKEEVQTNTDTMETEAQNAAKGETMEADVSSVSTEKEEAALVKEKETTKEANV